MPKAGLQPSELEVDKRLQVRGNELVEHEDGHDHDETHEPKREHGEVDAVPAFPTVRKPVDEKAILPFRHLLPLLRDAD